MYCVYIGEVSVRGSLQGMLLGCVVGGGALMGCDCMRAVFRRWWGGVG